MYYNVYVLTVACSLTMSHSAQQLQQAVRWGYSELDLLTLSYHADHHHQCQHSMSAQTNHPCLQVNAQIKVDSVVYDNMYTYMYIQCEPMKVGA